MEAIGSLNAPRGTVHLWIKRDKGVRDTKNRRGQAINFKEMMPGIAHQGGNRRL